MASSRPSPNSNTTPPNTTTPNTTICHDQDKMLDHGTLEVSSASPEAGDEHFIIVSRRTSSFFGTASSVKVKGDLGEAATDHLLKNTLAAHADADSSLAAASNKAPPDAGDEHFNVVTRASGLSSRVSLKVKGDFDEDAAKRIQAEHVCLLNNMVAANENISNTALKTGTVAAIAAGTGLAVWAMARRRALSVPSLMVRVKQPRIPFAMRTMTTKRATKRA